MELLPKEVTDSLTQRLGAGAGGSFVLYTFFFKARINSTAIFLVILWPLIFTKNHCVYVK